MNDLHTPQISLFSEHEEPQSYEVYVYGTDDLNEQNKDSFCVALCRYLDEINISQKTLARLTGIAPSTLSRYLSGKRKMQYDYLCAVCIAIRLHPFRQRYLFSLLLYAMPCDQDYRKADKNIIRAYLDGCAFDKRFTLTACNEQLKAIHTKPLTNLTSAKEDEKEYNKLLRKERYIEELDAKNGKIYPDFDDVLSSNPDPASIPISDEEEKEQISATEEANNTEAFADGPEVVDVETTISNATGELDASGE